MKSSSVSFILVNPKEAGNIGAAARAIKNMGFKNLALVAPRCTVDKEALYFAHGAEDVIKNLVIYPTLKSALKHYSVVVAFTRRKRKKRPNVMPLEDGCKKIREFSLKNHIALLFGNEDTGLSNEEIKEAHYIVTIPTHTTQPSLNLSHAVLIAAYALFHPIKRIRPSQISFVSMKEMHDIYVKLAEVLVLLDYTPQGSRSVQDSIIHNFEHIFSRAGITRGEANMLLGLCARIKKKLSGKEHR